MLRKSIGWTAVLVLAAMMAAPTWGQEKEDREPGVSVTVYNNGFALVKDRREMELPRGISTIKFTDVAATIDATSVRFMSVTDAKGTRVIEQNYEFDLVSADKILQKYIDSEIKILTKDGQVYEGKLLSFDGRQIVMAQKDRGISMVERGDNIRDIMFGELPKGLLTRPTLVWLLEAQRAGKHLVKVSYVARNIQWRSDYSLVLNENETMVDMSGWVTIDNKSGTGYEKAHIKLLAGETRPGRMQRQLGWGPTYYKGLSELEPTAEVGQEKGERFADYWLYRLNEPSTINQNQVKQIELMNANKVKVEKLYVYDGAQVSWNPMGSYVDRGFIGGENKKVNVMVQLENRKANQMGFSLPGGVVRVFKRDDDGSMEFLGEDRIGHTPRDEKVTLYIGDAFDVVGERRQTSFDRVGNVITEGFEIKVRNHKEQEVTVRVLEKMYRWREWQIIEQTDDFVKLDSRTVEFPVKVPANGEKVVRYKVRYTVE